MTALDLTVADEIPRDQAEEALRRIQRELRPAGESVSELRLTLRDVGKSAGRRYIADADVRVDGRLLAAHATGASVLDAADEVARRLRSQIRRVVDERKDERRAGLPLEEMHRPQRELKPPEQRQIVHRRPYVDVPLSTVEALDELLDLDVQFFLFVHVRTREDVVVHRRDDGSFGLLFPRGSTLADEDDIVVPEPSRYSEPLTIDKARAEMDFVNHRWLYFIAAEDGRGRVIYLRHDGDYGLVEPA